MAIPYEMIDDAKRRERKREEAYKAEQQAKHWAKMQKEQDEFEEKLRELLGDKLVAMLDSSYVPGELKTWRFRARFEHHGCTYEFDDDGISWQLYRCDAYRYDDLLQPLHSTEFRDLDMPVVFKDRDGNHVAQEERADIFLVKLSELAARPSERADEDGDE